MMNVIAYWTNTWSFESKSNFLTAQQFPINIKKCYVGTKIYAGARILFFGRNIYVCRGTCPPSEMQ